MRTPGANVTGIMSSVDGLPGKQVEIARELIPGLVRLGMLVNVSSPSAGQRPNVEMAARASNLELAPFEVRGPDDLDPTFQALAREKAEGLVVLQDTMFFSYRQRIAALAVAAKLPTVFGFRDHVDAGGLISYGVNVRANHRRAAAYVVEILKGAKPSDLPVEFPTKLELIINLKTAKALGLRPPCSPAPTRSSNRLHRDQMAWTEFLVILERTSHRFRAGHRPLGSM